MGVLALAVGQFPPASAALAGQHLDEPEDLMSSAVTGLSAIVGTPGRAAAPQMLDGTDGAARLVFKSSDGRSHTAKLLRWIAIIRLERSAARAARFVWLLDARTARWSGGLPPGELYRGTTGLNSRAKRHATPVAGSRAARAAGREELLGPGGWRRPRRAGNFRDVRAGAHAGAVRFLLSGLACPRGHTCPGLHTSCCSAKKFRG